MSRHAVSSGMMLSHVLDRYRYQFAGVFLLFAVLYCKIFLGMARQWCSDDNYTHGFIVPVIASCFVFHQRLSLLRTEVAPWNPGFIIITLGLLQLLFGVLGAENFTMRSSSLVVMAGLILFFLGRQVFNCVLFPCCYLLLMIPVPYIVYDSVAFPLKLFVSKLSAGLLAVAGVTALREGNVIFLPALTLEVNDACGGVRSLVSLLAVSTACAYYVRTGPGRCGVMVMSAIPIAIFTNTLRIVMTGFLAQYFGSRAAEGFFHAFTGVAVFGLSVVLLLWTCSLVKR